MNNLKEKEELNIEDMIYEIRGVQVMLDSDLAKLYQVETKRINEAVRNNTEKFPERFSWKLTNGEVEYLWSKFSTANISSMSRSNPKVFTEQGVAMLATILKSKVAIQVSINIMDTFVKMRKYISTNLIEQRYINNQVMKNTDDIKLLQQSFSKFDAKTSNNEIFFEGQIYDAYSKIVDILNKSINEVIIIDNYLDKNMLDIISKCKNKVILITADKLDNIDFTKYNKQYSNLEVIINKSFHDRFIILDKKILYHLGALNSLGKKCFAITKVEDEIVLKQLLERI